MKRFIRHLLEPNKIKILRREFGSRPFRLLDVGAGNHSAQGFRHAFAAVEYYGIDRRRDYNNSAEDFAAMTGFWEKDLTELSFADIPDSFFDAIVMNHVVEHLYNGDAVVAALLPKLKPDGIIYIEFPGYASTRLPSMRESLNFFDDPTHIRIFSVAELYNVLMRGNCKPLAGGFRRNWAYLLLMPLYLPYVRLRRGYFVGGDFWDLFGFAEFALGRKLRS